MGGGIGGKVFAISGASSGLGRALAVELAKNGALLSLFARDKQRLQNTAEECGGKTAPHIATGDIRSGQECRQWITAAAAHFGRLDGLVNNAGISMRMPVGECADIGIFREVMDAGFWGAAQCAHAALPHLRASGGMIVNISSVQGKTAIPQHSVYAASKHAIEGFFMSMAMEEPGIHFLSVRPGWINGTRINQNRIGNGKKEKDGGEKGDGGKDGGEKKDGEKDGGGKDNSGKGDGGKDDSGKDGGKDDSGKDGGKGDGGKDGGENGKSATPPREGLAVEYCAKKIVAAIKSRREVLTIPSRYGWLPILAEIFPRAIRRAVRKKTEARYYPPPQSGGG